MTVPYETANPKQKYVLSSYSEKHFFTEKVFTGTAVKNLKDKPINMLLNGLKKGKKNRIHNINFVGGQPTLLPGAYPSLKRLHKLMKKNKGLKIVIEGHTNGCDGGFEITQILSENRAKVVENYLTDNGILQNRIQTKGYNCKDMLYPNVTNALQQRFNRRVEILVTDL
jgi:outer membrane protein OmpA-like peptidoglycan-associated protein